MTVRDYATRWGVDRVTVYRWIAAGHLIEGEHYRRTPTGRIQVAVTAP
jgi:predicted site-specific integrase-resolvase